MPAARVFEDEHVLAFMDVFPQGRGHTLVIPKHSAARNLLDEEPLVLSNLILGVQRVARAVRAALKPDALTVMQFNGAVSGQTVFHLHFHIIPRWDGVPLAATPAAAWADPAELKALAEQISAMIKLAFLSRAAGQGPLAEERAVERASDRTADWSPLVDDGDVALPLHQSLCGDWSPSPANGGKGRAYSTGATSASSASAGLSITGAPGSRRRPRSRRPACVREHHLDVAALDQLAEQDLVGQRLLDVLLG